MKIGFYISVFGVAMALQTNFILAAHAESKGEKEFVQSCASCHGQMGNGNGPMTELLSTQLPDLTALSKNNGGVFPYEQVYAIIAGDADVKWHGSREMPIWGSRYMKQSADRFANEMLNQETLEIVVQTRILSLVDYLHTIQQK